MTLSHTYIMTLEELTTLEKLNNAFEDCSKISHWKESTQRYRANLLSKNLELQNDLRSGTYKVSDTIDFILNERGKVRNINAPAIRDRIVQKIICKEILTPQLSKFFIYDNYASLKNRGTSLARKRIEIMLKDYMRKHGNDGYILQVDIKKFFDSINHEILKDMFHKKIDASPDVLDLIDYLVDTSSKTEIGLNLGAECPQIFAILYLNDLDNYLKTVKRVKYYGRYMDDFFIISDSKQELKELLELIKTKLKEVKLETNVKKTHITSLKHGFTFMQIKYSLQNGKVVKRPSHSKIVRERRKLKRYKKKYDAGEMQLLDIQNTYKSWRNNILKDCNACNKTIYEMDKLFKKLFSESALYKKETREKLIKKAYKEEYNGKNHIR